jgi:hypothetical protein
MKKRATQAKIAGTRMHRPTQPNRTFRTPGTRHAGHALPSRPALGKAFEELPLFCT